ncbi:MAG: M3 family metallopeptidase [Prevotellaceae bacterium]|jgi:peptidyl-dipeptidase Dcp|nr:M3 family metallopeptidase [Prevotellaceae bacterium]
MNIIDTNNRHPNPFLEEYTTPHATTPFDRICVEHYESAMKEGICRQNEEISAIVGNPEAPTFDNTIVAYERSGQLLDRVEATFDNLLSAETTVEMQRLARSLVPLYSEHVDSIFLNEALFERVRTVYNDPASGNLDAERRQLLENLYDSFMRGGANLQGEDKETFRALNRQLSLLQLQFLDNNLAENHAFRMILDEAAQLSGLPQSAVDAAAQTARENGESGWMITLQAPSYNSFMTYADDRQLRRMLYMGFGTRCMHGNQWDNLDVVKKIVNTRMKIVQLLGYTDYAQYKLQRRMAQSNTEVYSLLNQLLDAYAPTAREEYREVQALAQQTEGDGFVVMPWDWAYYSSKLKKQKYKLDSELLRPYLELNRVIAGVFGLATRLYGITFRKNPDIPVYHKEVEAFEVYDQDGTFLAVLYVDFYPRPGKRQGAWMTCYKTQWRNADGTDSRPHISLVMNFTRPVGDRSTLLTFDELKTFLHEFGHALHGIFSNVTYKSLSGTGVYYDFVELPSQFMENYAANKEFLHTFARHYQTDEPIPDEWIDRLIASSNFNAGYACLRQLGFGFLDMAWHTRTTLFDDDVVAYEQQVMAPVQVLPVVKEVCVSAQFGHIFSGEYAAGYYSYKWSEVLDADAYSLFEQRGSFDRATAASFRENILSKGGTEYPMTLYKRFRGQEPAIDALLIRNEIKK